MRRHLAYVLFFIGTLSILLGLLNWFLKFLLPAQWIQSAMLVGGFGVTLLSVFANLKDNVEFFKLISSRNQQIQPSPINPNSPFWENYIWALKNSRIRRQSDVKTYSYFNNNLFITVIRLDKETKSGWMSKVADLKVGSPGYKDLHRSGLEVGDSFVYEADKRYDIRIAQMNGYYGSTKIIVVRSDKSSVPAKTSEPKNAKQLPV
jgi:hypothetical protein